MYKYDDIKESTAILWAHRDMKRATRPEVVGVWELCYSKNRRCAPYFTVYTVFAHLHICHEYTCSYWYAIIGNNVSSIVIIQASYSIAPVCSL